jgi:hypothetical protein
VQATVRWRRAARSGLTLAELTLIALVVWLIGAQAHAFTGHPKGYDATGHLSKARFIFDNWPHVSWNYQWYSGEPAFSDYPGYHVLLALIAAVGHVSLPRAMMLVAYASMVFVVAGLYGTVRAATGSRLSALIAAGLLVGTPTLWAQVVVLGLYPRFAALGMMSVTLAAAVAHSRRGGRWRGALTCVLLSLSLSMHPIVGMIAVGLVIGVYLLDLRLSVTRRCFTAATVVLTGFGLNAWFYLPLGLSSRSQTLFTDKELSLSWGMLFRPAVGHLDGLTPALLPLGLIVICFAVWQLLPLEIPFAEKVALGTDVTFLSSMSPDTPVPATAGPVTRRFFQRFRVVRSLGLPYRLALLFAVSTAAVFAYGFVGLAVPHFAYYVNGLQPYDLMVYPAYLLSGIVGLVIEPLRLTVAAWLARVLSGIAASVLRVAMPGAALSAAVVLIGVTAWNTSGTLKAPETTNDDIPARASLLPAESAGQFQYRFAGAADSTTEWVNDYSAVPQTRGYDDHAALHLDWQVWLETSLLKASASPQERRFLLDWYGVKWIDVDANTGDLTQYRSDPATYAPLDTLQQPGIRMQTYRYQQATPILSASSAPSVLVIGDDQRYDLMLRALALSGVGSDRLVLVHGPASLDDVTPALLRSFQTVALYGPTVANAQRDAALLGDFVRGGGGLFVDGAENSPAVSRLAGLPGSPFPVAAVAQTTVPESGWAFTPSADPTVVAADLTAFGPPAYDTSGGWSTETATRLQPGAHEVLATHGHTVAAAGAYGSGQVFWEGLNLPYHLNVFRSEPEAAFLARALLSLAEAAPAPTHDSATYANPQSWQVSTAGARGVLFKEQDAPGWHATVDGKPTPIYPAGPGMMWVPLTGSGPVTVALTYRLSSVEKLGFAGSFGTLIAMAVLLLSGRARRLFSGRARRLVDGPTVDVPRDPLLVG